MERFLSLLAASAIVCCFVFGYLALRQFARAEDLRGLFYAAVMLASGLFAQKILGVRGGQQ